MNKKKVFFIILTTLIFLVSIFFLFFYNKTAKISKIGNNTNNQEIINYILNISSYEAVVDVEIESNKNTNKYKLKQQYINPDISTQEVIEPSNIKGIKIIKNKNNLKIENTNLKLTTIIENYEDISENSLDLSSFIEEYKTGNKSNYKEENGQIIMEIETIDKNNNVQHKILTVDKKTKKPVNMKISYNNQKNTVYILYNEVKINSIKEQNILAIHLYNNILMG